MGVFFPAKRFWCCVIQVWLWTRGIVVLAPLKLSIESFFQGLPCPINADSNPRAVTHFLILVRSRISVRASSSPHGLRLRNAETLSGKSPEMRAISSISLLDSRVDHCPTESLWTGLLGSVLPTVKPFSYNSACWTSLCFSTFSWNGIPRWAQTICNIERGLATNRS